MSRFNPFERLLIVLVPLALVFFLFAKVRGLDFAGGHDGYGLVRVTLSDSVAQTLERNWATYSFGRIENERVYCISRWSVSTDQDSLPNVRVEEVYTPKYESTPVSVWYSCGMQPSIHTHPPQDCDSYEEDAECWRVPESDENCEPSDIDISTVLEEWHRFHGIQCGPRRFLWFVPYWS